MHLQIINEVNSSNAVSMATHHHFSGIAPKYRDLRTTDPEPIAYIAEELKNLASIKAVDIGCGTGRYDLLLYQYLGDKLHLACVDANGNML